MYTIHQLHSCHWKPCSWYKSSHWVQVSPEFISYCVMCLYCYSEDTLNILNTIQEIKGTLSIERWPYSKFPFLSNLRILGSNISNLRPFPSECANGSSVRYALFISNNNNLTSIDLSSLTKIKGGGFYLGGNNPQLCLIGNLSSLVTSPSASVCVTAQGRRDPHQCGEIMIFGHGSQSTHVVPCSISWCGMQ